MTEIGILKIKLNACGQIPPKAVFLVNKFQLQNYFWANSKQQFFWWTNSNGKKKFGQIPTVTFLYLWTNSNGNFFMDKTNSNGNFFREQIPTVLFLYYMDKFQRCYVYTIWTNSNSVSFILGGQIPMVI